MPVSQHQAPALGWLLCKLRGTARRQPLAERFIWWQQKAFKTHLPAAGRAAGGPRHNSALTAGPCHSAPRCRRCRSRPVQRCGRLLLPPPTPGACPAARAPGAAPPRSQAQSGCAPGARSRRCQKWPARGALRPPWLAVCVGGEGQGRAGGLALLLRESGCRLTGGVAYIQTCRALAASRRSGGGGRTAARDPIQGIHSLKIILQLVWWHGRARQVRKSRPPATGLRSAALGAASCG